MTCATERVSTSTLRMRRRPKAYVVGLALDLDLVVVGLEECSAAGATVAGRTLTVTTSEVATAYTVSIVSTYHRIFERT